MKLIHLVAGAVIALMPLTANAASLQMRINGGADGAFSDVDGDGRLVVTLENETALDGFDLLQVNAVRKTAPPFDQLLANMTVAHNASNSVLVEVTAHFTNPGKTSLPGVFSATANDATQSEWQIRSYIGSSAYDMDGAAVLVLDTSADGVTTPFAVRSIANLDIADYWVTHALRHTGGPDTVAAGAADFAAIPLPASGILLLGALGGIGALMRRRTG